MQADSDIQLLSMLSGRIVRGVDLEVYFSQVPGLLPQPDCLRDPLYTYLRGLPVLLVANLNDSQGGIGAATVEAVVDNPDRTTNRLVLFDDGLHDDGLAGDGIYANRYTKTPFFSTGGQPDFPLGPPSGQWGSYGVLITASGESNYREQFSRSELRSFQVFEFAGANSECDPDLDDDELPDRWEDLYGLDKMDPFDAVIDHDGDGLDALTEFKQGGHPFDADTDDGGEADGSELEAGRDMLYTRDDALPEIVDYGIVTQRTDLPVHEPVPETNILHFPVHPSYRLMHVYRTDPAWPGFQRVVSVDLTSDPRGVYYDRPLINGFPYSYYLVAEGLSGARTASTAVFSNTPAADPLPPKGWIKLNGGLAQASSFNVVVDVDTSDDSVEMMLSEDAGFDGAVWVPIASGFGYALTPQAMPATRTLYARFRDAAGNVSIDYHDTIEVTAAADNDGDNVPDVADNCTLVPNPTQLDTNGDGFGNICDADLDNDLVINFSDLAIFKGVFFTADPDADFDGNGSVNFTDLGVLKQQFFGTPGPAGPVP